MFCSKCGANLPDGSRFCDKCGAALEAPAAPAYEAPAAPAYEAPAYQQAPVYAAAPVAEEPKGTVKGLVFSIIGMSCGILGTVLCWYPIVGLMIAIIGIVFSALGKGEGKKGMCVVGLVFGIIGTVLGFILTIALWEVFMLASTASYYYY